MEKYFPDWFISGLFLMILIAWLIPGIGMDLKPVHLGLVIDIGVVLIVYESFSRSFMSEIFASISWLALGGLFLAVILHHYSCQKNVKKSLNLNGLKFM